MDTTASLLPHFDPPPVFFLSMPPLMQCGTAARDAATSRTMEFIIMKRVVFSSLMQSALKTVGAAGYVAAIGLVLFWSFSGPYSNGTRVYAQSQKGNAARK